MTRLHLVLRFHEVPQQMFESLANAVMIQDLQFGLPPGATDEEYQQSLSSLVVGDGGNGVALRLLQNPQSRLQVLDLNGLGLEDDHFIAIVQALPASHVSKLDVGNNNIQSRAIIEFAKELPNIQPLKSISLGPNPWLLETSGPQCSAQSEECWTALVEGMMGNFSVEELDAFSLVEVSAYYPHIQLLMHFLNLNRAGRHILVTSDSIPVGLWPHVLERAGKTITYHPHQTFDLQRIRVNAVYFMVQNCPHFVMKTS